ncbi:MAG: response regulator [Candidatus Margulisiibacteriota bacterium]
MSAKRILIVEDECIIATDIQFSLQSMGYEVLGQASSGLEAIEKASLLEPDVVLMDINLKGDMDGITAADHIYQKNSIPVIYLTANSDEQLLNRAKHSHAYGYLIKPFDDREMKSMIELTLEKHNFESQVHRNCDWLTTILRSITDSVIVAGNNGNIQMMNPSAERLTGWTQAEADGKNLHELLLLASDRREEAGIDFITEIVSQKKSFHSVSDTFVINKAGHRIPISYNVAPLIQNDIVEGMVITFQDRTQQRSVEQKLRNLALTDDLTGLYNRYGFFTLGRNLFEKAEANEECIVIAYADLDNWPLLSII